MVAKRAIKTRKTQGKKRTQIKDKIVRKSPWTRLPRAGTDRKSAKRKGR